MRVLLDTHLLLWAAGMSRRLPAEARVLIVDPANEVYFSSASVWEIAIKRGLDRADFRVDPDRLLHALPEMGLIELAITARHAAEVVRLPPIHKDPFDRILVAQSRCEPMILLTNDAVVAEYWDGVRLIT